METLFIPLLPMISFQSWNVSPYQFCVISGLYPRGWDPDLTFLYLSKRISQCWVFSRPKPGDSQKILTKA